MIMINGSSRQPAMIMEYRNIISTAIFRNRRITIPVNPNDFRCLSFTELSKTFFVITSNNEFMKTSSVGNRKWTLLMNWVTNTLFQRWIFIRNHYCRPIGRKVIYKFPMTVYGHRGLLLGHFFGLKKTFFLRLIKSNP